MRKTRTKRLKESCAELNLQRVYERAASFGLKPLKPFLRGASSKSPEAVKKSPELQLREIPP